MILFLSKPDCVLLGLIQWVLVNVQCISRENSYFLYDGIVSSIISAFVYDLIHEIVDFPSLKTFLVSAVRTNSPSLVSGSRNSIVVEIVIY